MYGSVCVCVYVCVCMKVCDVIVFDYKMHTLGRLSCYYDVSILSSLVIVSLDVLCGVREREGDGDYCYQIVY